VDITSVAEEVPTQKSVFCLESSPAVQFVASQLPDRIISF